MNHYVRLGLPLVFVSLIVLTGCQKASTHTSNGNSGGNTNNGSGGCPTSLKITASDSTPVVGSNVTIRTNQDGPPFGWSGPGNYSLPANGGQDSITINQIEILQSGWYYCTGSEPGCNNSIFDSVYIDVQYQQGSPSCSLTNDQISNTAGLPTFTGGTITKSFSGSYNATVLTVSDNVVEYDFVFNSNLGDTEPKDGIYYTTNMAFFDPSLDADVMNVNINYFPYYLLSDNSQQIYVSHVNGKMRLSFCSLSAEGSGANGLFTGQVTEQ
jgi:hypothetical protein